MGILSPMKVASLIGLCAFVFGVLTSCESTNSRRAGGGAFDESDLGRKLDANIPLDAPDSPKSRSSYEQWRESN